jgi:hypothetical protein
MGPVKMLHLERLPWPISILKCNRCVEALMAGEALQVFLKDAGTAENLVMMLNARNDCDFSACESADGFEVNIKKKAAQI